MPQALPAADHTGAFCYFCSCFSLRGSCEHQYTGLHSCGMAIFHASMAKKPRQKKGQKPRLESMCPESPEAEAVGASGSSGPAVNAGASSSSAPAVNVGASSSSAPALNVGADCWWEKDMARSLKSWDFFERQAQVRARSRRLPRI